MTGVGAVERRRLAERPARVRRQQRPGHDHRDRRDEAAPQARGDRARQPQEQPLQRPATARATSSRAASRSRRTTSACSSRASSPSRGRAASRAPTQGRRGRRLPAERQQQARSGSAATAPRSKVTIAPQVTGFTVDSTGDGVPDPTSAFPNQMQSIVIRGNQAYLPNIAASPTGPLRFNVDTQAFVNVLDGAQQRHHARRERGQVREPAPRRAPARAGQEEAVLRERVGASPSRSAAAAASAT